MVKIIPSHVFFKFGNEKIIIESLILLLNQYIIILLKEEEPDFSLRRVGVYAGKIDSEIDSKAFKVIIS